MSIMQSLTNVSWPTLVLVFLICVLIQKLFFTRRISPPLPPFPGIKLPVIGHLLLLDNDMRKPLRKFRRKIGDVYSLYFGCRLVVVVSGYKALKDAFLKNPEMFENRPSLALMDKVSRKKGIVLTNDEYWKQHRRFTLSTLKDLGMGRSILEDKMHEEARRCLEAFEEENGRPFDPKMALCTSVANITCSMVFGVSFKNGDQSFSKLVNMFEENMSVSGSAGIANFFPLLINCPGDPCKAQRSLRNANTLIQYCRDLVEKHIEERDNHEMPNDYIYAYVKEMENQQSTGINTTFSLESLSIAISDLFMAGSETTSTTLRWAMACLVSYPETQEKMYTEIAEYIGLDRLPSVTDRTKLIYVEAFYMEVLRYCNISFIGFMHGPKQETIFSGYTIPADAIILPDLDSVMSDPEIWVDPENFRPERFINEEGKIEKKPEFMAFFLGKRSCVGESLARMEMFLFLSSIVQRFRLENVPGQDMESIDGKFGMVHAPKPFKIIARPRL